jgi:hypothetical protein
MGLILRQSTLGIGIAKNSSRMQVSASSGPPGSPLYWWDATDLTTLYTVEAKTTNVAADEDNVQVWTSKGSSALDLTTAGTTSEYDAVWAGNGAPGVIVAHSVSQLGAEVAGTAATGGWTVVGVYSSSNGAGAPGAHYPFSIDTPNVDCALQIQFDDPALVHDGTSSRHVSDELVENEIVGCIGDHEATGGAFTHRASNSASLVSGTDTYGGGFAAGDDIGMCVASAVAGAVTIGELIVYEGSLADNGLTDEDLVTWLQDRWGITFTAIA